MLIILESTHASRESEYLVVNKQGQEQGWFTDWSTALLCEQRLADEEHRSVIVKHTVAE